MTKDPISVQPELSMAAVGSGEAHLPHTVCH